VSELPEFECHLPPWTEQDVANINAFQTSGAMQPLTCGCRDDEHPDRVLVARPDGLHCPNGRCAWVQTAGVQRALTDGSLLQSIKEYWRRMGRPAWTDRRCLTGSLHSTTECCEHWPTVTICGSMRFYHQMLTVAEELTLDGIMVLMPFVRKEPFMEADVNHPGNVIEKLDAQHKRKIDLATSIVVVSDETGYYGDSTHSEIDYAQSQGKSVTYRRVALKHTCAGHPSAACAACRAAKQRVSQS
jgi:hypothetical protein